MSDTVDDIREQMAIFSSKYGPASIIDAVVKELNEDDTIVVELEGGDIIDDVRLKSLVKEGNKFILIPAIDSVVLIGRIRDSEEWVMITADEVDKLILIIGDARFEVDTDGFILQKENDTLKEVLSLIIEAVKTIVVLQGRNPDLVKLQQALDKTNNLFKS